MTAPGTYTGKDGREYRWVAPHNNGQYRPVLTTTLGYECGIVYLSAADWPAARAALDALVEAEQEEWVEIDDHARIKRDGTQPQHRTDCGIGRWNDLTHPDLKRWPQAYRKGRSVAQQESAEMRDAARELVEAIDFHGSIAVMSNGVRDWLRDVRTLAKKLEGKL